MIKSLFAKMADARRQGQLASVEIDGADRTTLSAAVLMVEVARLDTDFSQDENDRMCQIMRREFGLSLEEANALLDDAENRHEEAYTNWLFTKTIKERAGIDERAQVMEYLWEIAYADGELHDLEADLLLRIGQSIGLPENERIKALERVLTRRAS